MMRRMMSGVYVLAIAGLLFGLTSRAGAQMKVGFVFMDEIRQRAQPYQEIMQRLQQMAAQRQQEADQKQAEIQRLQDQFERQRNLMTEQTRAQRQAQIQQKLAEYQQWANQAQQELARQQAELMQPLEQRVLELIRQIAEERNYDLVLDGTAIAYIRNHEEHNLTEAVIEALNAE